MKIERRKKDRRDGAYQQDTESNSLLLEVIEASLRISKRDQLFSWLQSYCQYVFPHEILLCGVQSGKDKEFRFESFSSTRYVTEQHLLEATGPAGVLSRAVASWQASRKPVFLAEGIPVGDFGSYVVPFAPEIGELGRVELKNIAAHGLGSVDGGISTFFCFARVPGAMDADRAYLLEFLVPHLHAALVRLLADSVLIPGLDEDKGATCAISRREREILQWVHHGKTNWEIAGILEISPLTVKNHVQNILRKLNVQNRSHAAVKASRMGLVKV